MQLEKAFIESLDIVEFSEEVFLDDRFFTGLVTISQGTEDRPGHCFQILGHPGVMEAYLWCDGDGIILENPLQYNNIKNYAEECSSYILEI